MVVKDRDWQIENGIIVPCACGRLMERDRYICNYCERTGRHAHEPPPKLMQKKPDVRPPIHPPSRELFGSSTCGYCEYNSECMERVRDDLWVLCEIPNEQDLMIAGDRLWLQMSKH